MARGRGGGGYNKQVLKFWERMETGKRGLSMWSKHSPLHPTEVAGGLLSAQYQNWEDLYVADEHMKDCPRCFAYARIGAMHTLRDCAAVRAAGIKVMRGIAALMQEHAAHHVIVLWVWQGLVIAGQGREVVLQWFSPQQTAQAWDRRGDGKSDWWRLFVGSLPSAGVLESLKKILRVPPEFVCAKVAQVVSHRVLGDVEDPQWSVRHPVGFQPRQDEFL